MNWNAKRTLPALALAAAVSVAAVAALHAAGTPPERPRSSAPASAETPADGKTNDLYAQGYDLAKSENYAEARKIFEDLAAREPKNPEVLNMLAYTQRKTGDVDEALDNYERALKLRPKFPQAREYRGEAYLQAAMSEAELLKSYGKDGEEDLKKLADAFQEAASKMEGIRPKGDAKSGW